MHGLNNTMSASMENLTEVVVSGFSGRLPESDNIAEFRENLFNGVDMVTEDGRRWEPGMFGLPRRNGKLKDLSKFDASFFGVHPKQADGMDPQLRMLLEVTYEAIVDAGVSPSTIRGSLTGVFVGCSASEVHDVWTADADKVTGYEMTGCTRSMFANRLSYFFDFKGPSFALDTACSSSLLALDQALRAIRSGQCDAAIVAGTSICVRPSTSAQFQKLGMLSADGACKSFDVSGNGYCRSEAIVAVYLQKRSVANRVYASLIHSKNNSDGHKDQGITFPSGEMQKRLLTEVYSEAGVDPTTVSYVELHGTGTHAGDPQEANSVDEVFCGSSRTSPLLIGSTKSNMGHPEPASGLAALAKVLIAMHDGVIPPNLHYREPNPDIPALLEGRFKVVDKATPWNGGYVGINSFGFGGSNVHVLLRSGTAGRKSSHPAASVPRLIAFAGRTAEGVEKTLTEAVKQPTDVELHALLENSVCHLPPVTHPYRGMAIVNSSVSRQSVEKVSAEDRPVWYVFAGMGTQWPKMGRDLMTLDVFRDSIVRSNAVLEPYNIHLCDLLMSEREDTFNDTLNSFIGIAAIQVALVDVLKSVGVKPDGIVGHSVGELGCAYADGALTAEETVLAAYWRGRCVAEANLPKGGMAAVGLTWEEAHRRCPQGIVPACHNSHDTVTISGPAAEVSQFVASLQKDGVFAKEVQSAGVAFHSYYMSLTAPALKERLTQVIKEPRQRSHRWISSSIPQANWDSELAKYSSAEYHVNNLVSPVLFQEALEHIPSNAIVVEIAPHSLLQAVLRRGLASSCSIFGLMDRRQPDNLVHMLSTLGKLYMNGVSLSPLKLYPAVEMPVSTTAPMISSLVQWDHTSSWAVPTAEQFIALGNGGSGNGSAGSFEIDISAGSEDAYLSGHVIDGRVLFPATGYLVLAWKQLARLVGQPFEQFSVVFEDVSIHRATILPPSGSVTFDVTVASGTGKFEVCENSTLVASGRVSVAAVDELDTDDVTEADGQPRGLKLDSDDVYKELRLRGYDYGPTFRGILSAAGDGAEGQLLWNGNWVSFLDTMLQMQVLSLGGRGLQLPTRIRRLYINPQLHKTCVQTLPDGSNNEAIRARNNKELGTCTAGGVELLDLHATVAPRRQGAQAPPTLESHVFVPYNEDKLAAEVGRVELSQYLETCSRYVLDNIRHLIKDGTGNGLQNVEMMKKLFSAQCSSSASLSPETVQLLSETKDCCLMRTLVKVFTTAHDSHFIENVEAALSAASSELVTDDRLTGFIRSDRCFKTCLDVVLENLSSNDGIGSRIKVVECNASTGYAFQHTVRQLSAQPAVSVKYFAADADAGKVLDGSVLDSFGVTPVDWSLKSGKSAPDQLKQSDLVILANVLHRQPNLSVALQSAADLLSDGGFLLVVEPTVNFAIPWSLFALANDVMAMSDLSSRSCGPFCNEADWCKVFAAARLEIVAQKSDGLLNTVFLCRRVAATPQQVAVIDVSDTSFSWLDDVKAVLNGEKFTDSTVWLKVEQSPTNGIVGMVNCLRREPNGEKLRCLFNARVSNSEPAKYPDEDLKSVYRKDLVMNVYRSGKWGSFRHVAFESGTATVSTEAAYVNVLTRGDLSSLRWIESPVSCFNPADNPSKELCRVAYTALNFRDIMLATGKLPPDAIPGDLASQDCLLGMEFSGYNQSGQRVMGLLEAKGLATVVDAPRDFLWPVPDGWTLEQAATVPVAYATAYYSLVVRGGIRAGETVLIHSGSGAVGQAAISIALSHGCRVLTTVGSDGKRAYLKKRFSQLSDSSFADSRDTKFWRTILKTTGGRGVDVVLNSLAEDKLQSSVQLLAQHGRFLEIGKYDLSNNNPLGMSVFLRNVAFHGILLDALFEPGNPDWRKVYDLVSDGIKTGVVQPLQTSVFDRDDIENAFRFMAQGKHIGKVVIKIQDEVESTSALPPLKRIPAVARTVCNPRRSYIIVGGLGGLGLELTQWLIDRGAKHLVITSLRGVRNGYQDRRIREWRKSGIDVIVSSHNVSDPKEAAALITDAASRSTEGVGGVFNLAVVLQDGLTVNQTAKEWTRAAEPKVTGTENLDAATRQLCGKSLDWFIVFSSVSCGRGNAGQANYGFANSVMERICERRRLDGYHGMAIQWGAVGDVGVAYKLLEGKHDASIGGTLPQRISSCLATLDSFLSRSDAVVSSFVLAETSRGPKSEGAASGITLCDAVAHILGIKDASSVSPDLTLGDLGLDSLMGVEIKQMLERDYDITMSAKDIRALTFARLNELSTSKSPSSGTSPTTAANDKAADVMPVSTLYELKHLLPTEPVIKMNGIEMSSSSPPPLFVITPIDGSVRLLEQLVSSVKSPTFGVQCSVNTPLTSIRDLAAEYIQRVKSVCPHGPYKLVGYSFGACVAIEMVLQLQQQATSKSDVVSNLVLLDGSHKYVAFFTGRQKDKVLTGDVASLETAAICSYVSQIILRLDVDKTAISQVDIQKLGAELLTKPDWNSRVSHTVATLESIGVVNANDSAVVAPAVLQFYQKLKIADEYQPSTQIKDSTQITLVRASESTAEVETLGNDYGIGSVYEGRVKVHVVKGSHETIVTSHDGISAVSAIVDSAISS